jgi:hypothetical protein
VLTRPTCDGIAVHMVGVASAHHEIVQLGIFGQRIVKVKAPDNTNYVSTFAIRGGFNGYIIYTGNDQWMLQGVGANFNGA